MPSFGSRRPLLPLLLLLSFLSAPCLPLVLPAPSCCVLKIALDAGGNIGGTRIGGTRVPPPTFDPASPSPDPLADPHAEPASNSNPGNFRFTSPASLDLVHRLRACSDYVITGSRTVIEDNPSFSVRRGFEYERGPGNGPARVLVDRSLRTLRHPEPLKVLSPEGDDADTVLYFDAAECSPSCTPPPPLSPRCELRQVTAADPASLPASIVAELAPPESTKAIMVEGGAGLAAAFLPVVTHAIVIQSPRIVFREDGAVPGYVSDRGRLAEAGLEKVGEADSEGDTVEYWRRPERGGPMDDHFLESNLGLMEFLL
jgi:riboflavin biosynthesis pyrimidine reductase